ncbi:MAG: MarR family transcriptional regulator [Anaerolineae bacterium]
MGTHYQGTEEQVRALDTFIKLTRAASAVSSRIASLISEAGLTESQFGTLEALYHLGPLCSGEIGHKILRSSGNMTTVLDNLERRGLVRRERDEQDRRQVMVHLTAEGEALIRRIFPRHVEAITAEMSILTPQEQQTLGELCKIVGRQSRD